MFIKNILKIITLLMLTIGINQYSFALRECGGLAATVATIDIAGFSQNWRFAKNGDLIYSSEVGGVFPIRMCQEKRYYAAELLTIDLRGMAQYGFDIEVSGTLDYGYGSYRFIVSPRGGNNYDLPRVKSKYHVVDIRNVSIRIKRNNYSAPAYIPHKSLTIGKVMNSANKGRKEVYTPFKINFRGGTVTDCLTKIKLDPPTQTVNFDTITMRSIKNRTVTERTFTISVNSNHCPNNLNVSINFQQARTSRDLTEILLHNRSLALAIYDGTKKLPLRGNVPLFSLTNDGQTKSKTFKAVLTPTGSVAREGAFRHIINYRVTYK